MSHIATCYASGRGGHCARSSYPRESAQPTPNCNVMIAHLGCTVQPVNHGNLMVVKEPGLQAQDRGPKSSPPTGKQLQLVRGLMQHSLHSMMHNNAIYTLSSTAGITWTSPQKEREWTMYGPSWLMMFRLTALNLHTAVITITRRRSRPQTWTYALT